MNIKKTGSNVVSFTEFVKKTENKKTQHSPLLEAGKLPPDQRLTLDLGKKPNQTQAVPIINLIDKAKYSSTLLRDFKVATVSRQGGVVDVKGTIHGFDVVLRQKGNDFLLAKRAQSSQGELKFNPITKDEAYAINQPLMWAVRPPREKNAIEAWTDLFVPDRNKSPFGPLLDVLVPPIPGKDLRKAVREVHLDLQEKIRRDFPSFGDWD